jgi:flagellar basal-body rod protein FlgF
MNRGLYTATSGGIAALARLDSVAQNLANVGTAGYKAERLIFRVRPLAESVPRAGGDPIVDRTAAQVAQVATVRDFSQGPIRISGNPLDVAISGEGFFAVATPRGERYTRQGSFSLDTEGYLTTQHGERVAGEQGELRIPSGDVAIAGDGTVTVDGLPAGRLKVVSFGDTPALVPEGGALFAPAPGATPTPVDASHVDLQPGALEGANVDAVGGLIELVNVSRMFESYMKTLQRLDEVAGRSINEVGRVA